jgi:hypothetical protein
MAILTDLNPYNSPSGVEQDSIDEIEYFIPAWIAPYLLGWVEEVELERKVLQFLDEAASEETFVYFTKDPKESVQRQVPSDIDGTEEDCFILTGHFFKSREAHADLVNGSDIEESERLQEIGVLSTPECA